MKPVLKRGIMAVLLLLLAGFVALNLLAYSHARKMLIFSAVGERTSKPENLSFLTRLKVLIVGINLPRPESDEPPESLAPNCRETTIPASDSITLTGWYAQGKTNRSLVILFHGYGSQKTALVPEAQFFLEKGNSVLLVDFRGSGGSSENYTTIGVLEAEDVAAAVRYAKKNLPVSRIILYGRSMGAVAVLRAVSHDGGEPDGIILEATFDTMLHTVRNRFHAMRVPAFPAAELLVFWGGRSFGFNGFHHKPVDDAKRVRCPVLAMHGTDDPRATLPEGRRVFDAIPGTNKTFIVFEKSGHESYYSTHPEQWKAAADTWLRR
jgi:dipeptidyl aminopeptidase/acylaminoacyl peptidase